MVLNVISAPPGWDKYVPEGAPLYVLESSFAERQVAKDARLRWNPDRKRWWTTDIDRALCLLDCASPDCRKSLEAASAGKVASVEASQATNADVEIPRPEGLEYLPYQKAGIAFLLRGLDLSKPHAYIMGIGKEATNANGNVSQVGGVSRKDDGMPAIGSRGVSENKGVNQVTGARAEQGLERVGVESNESQNARSGNPVSPLSCAGNGQDAPWYELEGREWTGVDRNSRQVEQDTGASGIHQGTCSEDSGTINDTQSPNIIQGGFRQPNNEMRDRIGRSLPPADAEKSQGPQENGSSGIPRLDSAQNHTYLTKGGQTPSLGTLLADEMG